MEFYIIYEDENHGPLSVEQLSEYGLTPESRVWSAGWPAWKNAGDVPEIQEYLQRLQQQRLDEERLRRQKAQQAQAQTQSAAQPQYAAAEQISRPQNQSVQPPQPQSNAFNPTPGIQAAPQQTSSQPPIPQQLPSKWYMAVNNTESGPYTETELVALGLNADSLVWTEGMVDWTQAAQVAALSHLLMAQNIQQPIPQSQPQPQTMAATSQIYSAPTPAANKSVKPSSLGWIALAGTGILIVLQIMLWSRFFSWYYTRDFVYYLISSIPVTFSIGCSIYAIVVQSKAKRAITNAEFNAQQGVSNDSEINSAHRYNGIAIGASVITIVWTIYFIGCYLIFLAGYYIFPTF